MDRIKVNSSVLLLSSVCREEPILEAKCGGADQAQASAEDRTDLL